MGSIISVWYLRQSSSMSCVS